MYARSRSVVVAVVVLVTSCGSDGGALEDAMVPQPERTTSTLQTDSEKLPPSSTTRPNLATTTTTTTTTLPSALAFPRTYIGGGSALWSLSWADGSCLVEGNTLELTLKADGTLSGLYRRTEPTFVGSTSVECAEQVFVKDPIEVTGWHTPPGSGKSEAGTVAAEIVGWPDWHIEGEYTPSEMVFDWEIVLVATGYQGDQPDPRVTRAVDYQLPFTAED